MVPLWTLTQRSLHSDCARFLSSQVSVVALCAVFLVSFSTYVLYHMVKPDDGEIPHGSQHYKTHAAGPARPHSGISGVGHDGGLLGWGEEEWTSPWG